VFAPGQRSDQQAHGMTKLLATLSSVALAAALAGCGGSSGGSSSAGSTSAPSDQGVKFAQCMRKHGVQMEDPKPGEGEGLTLHRGGQEKVDAAMKACKAFAPVREGNGKMSAKDFDQLTRLAQCLRRNGIEAQDPKQGQPFRIKAARKGDQKAEAAIKTCHAEVGMPEPGSGGKTSPQRAG
jgi:hypothetical protein